MANVTSPRTRTLALGAPQSAFYRSLRRILFAFGDVEFVHERMIEPSELLEMVRRRELDQVLMPNPYGNPRRLACYRELRAAGIRVIASDRGALPDTWFFDHGFNADSPSYSREAWDRPLAEGERDHVRRYMEELRSGEAALEAQGPRRDGGALRRRLGIDEHSKVLFVPLQRPTDTVVRYFSGAVEDLDEMLEVVARAELLLARGGDDWRVVFKRHPLEPATAPPAGACCAPDDAHVHDLLEMSDAVLVLNSGVGLLSLIFGRPTLHMGQAIYGHSGLATHVRDEHEIAEALGRLDPPSTETVERFVHHLVTRVYSFATMQSELRRNVDGSLTRITRDLTFRDLRVLGREVPLPEARVLVVTPILPWPVSRGSQLRMDTMIRSLIEQGKLVSLCVLNTESRRSTGEIACGLRDRYPEVDRVEVRNHPKLARGVGRALHLALLATDAVTGGLHRISNLSTCPPTMRRAVAEVCDTVRPDYVLVSYAKLTPALPRGTDAVTIVDTHDIQVRHVREHQAFSRLWRLVDADRFARSETEALARYDRIIAINPNEAEELRRTCPRADVYCVPAFTDARPDAGTERHRYDCLFVGSGSSFNVDGLLWFAERVLPRIRAERPGFRLTVVGTVCRSWRARRLRHPGIELFGTCEDLAPMYEQTRVVIAPVLAGAGMKIKVVEALGFAKAIVCTTKAADGIALRHFESACIADDPAAFAEAVLRLSDDDQLRRRIERAALALHAEQHSPEAAARALRGVFTRI